jgi:hypothetical protein
VCECVCVWGGGGTTCLSPMHFPHLVVVQIQENVVGDTWSTKYLRNVPILKKPTYVPPSQSLNLNRNSAGVDGPPFPTPGVRIVTRSNGSGKFIRSAGKVPTISIF